MKLGLPKCVMTTFTLDNDNDMKINGILKNSGLKLGRKRVHPSVVPAVLEHMGSTHVLPAIQ